MKLLSRLQCTLADTRHPSVAAATSASGSVPGTNPFFFYGGVFNGEARAKVDIGLLAARLAPVARPAVSAATRKTIPHKLFGITSSTATSR
jgi:hypothetical protein